MTHSASTLPNTPLAQILGEIDFADKKAYPQTRYSAGFPTIAGVSFGGRVIPTQEESR
jgi:hypothetical protein